MHAQLALVSAYALTCALKHIPQSLVVQLYEVLKACCFCMLPLASSVPQFCGPVAPGKTGAPAGEPK